MTRLGAKVASKRALISTDEQAAWEKTQRLGWLLTECGEPQENRSSGAKRNLWVAGGLQQQKGFSCRTIPLPLCAVPFFAALPDGFSQSASPLSRTQPCNVVGAD